MRASSIAMWVGAALATALAGGCNEDDAGGDDTDGGGSMTTASTTEATGAPTGTMSTTGPQDCVPGNQDCVCLEGQCVGTLFCVMDECVPGPDVDLEGDQIDVLAGARLPIEFDVIADEFSWSQTDGPMANLGDAMASPLIIDVPAMAGSSITLRLTSVRNSVEQTDDLTIRIVDATVEDAFVDVGGEDDPPPPPLMLGQTEAVEFAGGELWVASSTEGTLTQVNSDGTVANTYNVGGTPMSLRSGEIPEGDDGLDVLYFADSTGQSINAFVFGNQMVRTITDADDNAMPLGPVHYVVPRDNGDLVFSNGTGGQVFYYDDASGSTFELVNATQMGPNPHALEFGPDGYLFVGTIGQVWKVPILGDDIVPPEDGDEGETIEAGPPELYLDIGASTDATLEVDGLAFDGALNLFVATSGSSTLHLARFVAEGTANVDNAWTRSGNPLGRFIGLRHGDGDFSDRSLYFASGAEGRVGRVYTGVDENL